MSNSLLVEEHTDAIVIRFNRPEIRNPLSIEVLEALSHILSGIDERNDIVKMIVTGGGGVFASGADLKEIARVRSDEAREFARRGQDLMHRISRLRPHTIAAVNGICFGGGLDLALACRKRIASPGATFAHPGASLGIITGWGGTQRLPRLIGEARALEMFFTARRVTANEALAIGLVDEISDDPVELAMKQEADAT